MKKSRAEGLEGIKFVSRLMSYTSHITTSQQSRRRRKEQGVNERVDRSGSPHSMIHKMVPFDINNIHCCCWWWLLLRFCFIALSTENCGILVSSWLCRIHGPVRTARHVVMSRPRHPYSSWSWWKVETTTIRSSSHQEWTKGQLAATTTTTTTTNHHHDNNVVVVVGGGVGGLALAARLAATTTTTNPPIRVTILEQNSETGGRCGSFSVTAPNSNDDDREEHHRPFVFRHERGPSLLLLPQMYEQLFTDVTRGRHGASNFGLSMTPCIPAYTVIFDDGDRIDLGFPNENTEIRSDGDGGDAITTTTKQQQQQQQQADRNQLRSESQRRMNQFETNGAQKWDDYMRLCRAYLECGLPNFIEERLDWKSFPNFIREGILRHRGQRFPLTPHRDVLDTFFTSEKMCALASFQDLYVGLQPFRTNNVVGGGVWQHKTAPAVFGLLSAIELHPDVGGVYAPMGGFQAVHQSLLNLATSSYCNVTIQCNCTVVQVTNDGVYYYNTTTQVDDTGPPVLQFLNSDVTVINADLPYAEKSLFPKPPNTLVDDRTKPSVLSRAPQPEQLLNMTYDWDDRYQFSSGVIAFHWSVNRSLVELNTHNVFLSASNRTSAYESWNFVRNVTQSTKFMMTNINEPFNFYLHRASKSDPTAAPDVSVFIRLPCQFHYFSTF